MLEKIILQENIDAVKDIVSAGSKFVIVAHKNPDGDKYPCYKVVNRKGKLSSAYAFGGIDEQKRRLEAEGVSVENGKVDLIKYAKK